MKNPPFLRYFPGKIFMGRLLSRGNPGELLSKKTFFGAIYSHPPYVSHHGIKTLKKKYTP